MRDKVVDKAIMNIDASESVVRLFNKRGTVLATLSPGSLNHMWSEFSMALIKTNKQGIGGNSQQQAVGQNDTSPGTA